MTSSVYRKIVLKSSICNTSKPRESAYFSCCMNVILICMFVRCLWSSLCCHIVFYTLIKYIYVYTCMVWFSECTAFFYVVCIKFIVGNLSMHELENQIDRWSVSFQLCVDILIFTQYFIAFVYIDLSNLMQIVVCLQWSLWWLYFCNYRQHSRNNNNNHNNDHRRINNSNHNNQWCNHWKYNNNNGYLWKNAHR